jgi:proteasome lid subunit RPN8/RPN11
VKSVPVARSVLNSILAESRCDPSREICGLLAGRDGVITATFLAPNVHSTPATAYEIAPQELFRIFREIRAQGLELLGIYHSHPTCDNAPSPADIERAYYPDAAYIIVSPHPDAKNPIRAFHIRNPRIEELELEIID